MFRKAQTIYCYNEDIAKQVRAYAQQLNLQAGGRAIISAEDKCKDSLHSAVKEPDDTPKTPVITPSASYACNFEGIPEILRDIMLGGTFPAPEDLTRDERYIIYDAKINNYLNLYRISKRADLVDQIKDRLRELRG